jgi:hypothetical protein
MLGLVSLTAIYQKGPVRNETARDGGRGCHDMPSYTLLDAAHGTWVESFAVHAQDFGPAPDPTAHWSVTKRRLHGGRRDGVDLIEVDNGAFKVAVVPTRGMGIWKANFRGMAVGWDSPVRDGPVNPAFVNLMNWGGLGWLEGFDELLARCGLEHNGAPYTEGHTTYGLHGKIANTPAYYVAVHVADGPDRTITVEGHVDESKLFSTQVRMVTTLTTAPGSNRLTVRDEFRNLSDLPQEMQVLYHWNFGPPFLEEGSRFAAPAKAIVPRNARAVEGLGHFDVYGAPEPGFAEQVYFYDLLGPPGTGLAGPHEGRTLVMLRDRAGDKAVVLRFDRSQLPAFSLWKNTGGLKSGYVTGLEPGTNYPNPKPFEKARGRVLKLDPGASHVAETTLEILATREAVSAAELEIAAIQKREAPVVHKAPVEPFAAP